MVLANTVELPVDGIVYVVDLGFSKLRVYNPRIRVVSLLTSPISKASAQQRASHAGRTKPGKCFRLYTKKYFTLELEEQTHPEILTSNLSNTLLTLMKLGVKDLIKFDFLDHPAPESLMRALEFLNYLGALDDDGNLTPSGSIMAEFPLDPQLAKMLIVSPEFNCSNDVLTIVAMMSVPDNWIRPNNRARGHEADAAKKLFTISGGDHLTLLNVYNQYMLNKDRDWTWRHHLSYNALLQVENERAHLRQVMERLDIKLVSPSDQCNLYTSIRQALVCGFFTQVARREGKKGNYLTFKDNQIVTLHPSCGLNDQPEWVVYNEFILTTAPYICTVSSVRPEWLIKYAADYFNPRTFTNGKTKPTLLRVINQRAGRATGGSRFKR